MHENILIIEDDDTLRLTVGDFLEKQGYRVAQAAAGGEGLEATRRDRFDLILLDLRLPDIDGMEVLKTLQEAGCEALVVIMTAYPEIRTAVSAIRAGAYDYINKPFDLEDLRSLIQRALETASLRREVAWRRTQQRECGIEGLIGESQAFKDMLDITRRMAVAGDVPVLIQGESGTGKEHVAHAIHCLSERAGGPWIAQNCSSIPENLLESELFGHEKGAFTDARQMKRGLLELANGGTLFLDEIGDLAPAMQPKLLRVLETQTFRRLGGEREIRVDVRFVAATNQPLATLVRQGKFREDLYYRLNVGAIHMPTLRERAADIPRLAAWFLDRLSDAAGQVKARLDPRVVPLLTAYGWPGNVRELRNVMERAAILAGGKPITAGVLPPEISGTTPKVAPAPAREPVSTLPPLAQVERDYILQVLDHCQGNKSRAAEILGITRLTLRTKLKLYTGEPIDLAR